MLLRRIRLTLHQMQELTSGFPLTLKSAAAYVIEGVAGSLPVPGQLPNLLEPKVAKRIIGGCAERRLSVPDENQLTHRRKPN
jgi:hypothetical protein